MRLKVKHKNVNEIYTQNYGDRRVISLSFWITVPGIRSQQLQMFGVFLSCSNISVHQRVQSSRCPSANLEGMWRIGVIDGDVISFTSRPLNPQRQRKLVGPHRPSGHFGEQKYPFLLLRFEKNSLDHISRQFTDRATTVNRLFSKMSYHRIASRYVTVFWKCFEVPNFPRNYL